MANRRYRTTISSPEEIDVEEQYGPQRFLETDIRTNPLLRSSFQFEELEERYPVLPIQMRQAREEDKMLREEDIEYKKSLINERLSEVELKKAARDLDMYEARINREDAMLEQAPLARQALGELDPRDPDYIKQRMKVFNEYPLAFEYEPFLNNVDKPLLDRHQRTANARSVIDGGGVGLREYQSAMGEISKYARLQKTDGITQGELEYLKDMEAIVDQYRAQQGGTVMPQGEPPLSPEPTEDMVEPQPVNIPPPEEDDEIYSEATAVIARNPALKDRVNQRLIQMGRKPID
jgi:hypothetical protein